MPSPEIYKLGKQAHKHDDRTLMLADYVEVPVIPSQYDFEKHRKPFPIHVWGNNDYGDCVIAAEANHVLRMERVEQRRTIKMTDQHAIDRYKLLTGCQMPGDDRDTGLVMLNAMKDWRNDGFRVTGTNKKSYRVYKISAFGELLPQDDHQLRACIYLLGGIHFGFALPATARLQTKHGVWDVVDGAGPMGVPGSWGGHAVFSCKYDPNFISVKTWGKEILVTNAFVKKYADEVWGVVDDLDKWSKSDHLDIQALLDKLHAIGAKVNN